MSTLANISAADDSDQTDAGNPQTTEDARVAPSPPVLPGTDGTDGAVAGIDADGGAPVMAMPGGPMDPAA